MTRARAGVAAAIGTATVAGVLLLLAGACFSERPRDAGPVGPVTGECRIPVGSPVIGTTGALVAIRSFAFQPETLRVRPGTTVTWLNCEPTGVDAHTSTADAGAWSSPFLAPGTSYSHTFTGAGAFDYHCVPHPSMRGVVVVE